MHTLAGHTRRVSTYLGHVTLETPPLSLLPCCPQALSPSPHLANSHCPLLIITPKTTDDPQLGALQVLQGQGWVLMLVPCIRPRSNRSNYAKWWKMIDRRQETACQRAMLATSLGLLCHSAHFLPEPSLTAAPTVLVSPLAYKAYMREGRAHAAMQASS